MIPPPAPVREWFASLAPRLELIPQTEEALQLRQAYLDAQIVTAKSTTDAFHVALATVANCRLIVSWNFKHIVHFQKIPLYKAVNRNHGYAEIDIYSPLEVIHYEGEEI